LGKEVRETSWEKLTEEQESLLKKEIKLKEELTVGRKGYHALNLELDSSNLCQRRKRIWISLSTASYCCWLRTRLRMNPYTPKPLGNGKFDIFLEGECIKRNFDPEKEFIKASLKIKVRIQRRI